MSRDMGALKQRMMALGIEPYSGPNCEGPKPGVCPPGDGRECGNGGCGGGECGKRAPGGRARRLTVWLHEYHELLGIPIGVILFLIAPGVLRWYDAGAGAFDPAVLQAMLYGIAGLMVGKGAAWLTLRWDFPEAYSLLDRALRRGLRQGRPAAVGLLLGLFAIYLLAFLALTAMLL